jgi:hypothetical protein
VRKKCRREETDDDDFVDKDSDDEIEEEEEPSLFDNFGKALVPFKNKHVRFTEFHLINQSEAFFYNILLRHVPFRREEVDILSACKKSKTYLEECQVQGIFTCDEDLEDAIAQYSIRNLQSSDERARLCDLVLFKTRIDPSLFSLAEATIMASHPKRATSRWIPCLISCMAMRTELFNLMTSIFQTCNKCILMLTRQQLF